MNIPLYPDVFVDLEDVDSDDFAIIGRVAGALKNNGHGEAAKSFVIEASDGDHNHLIDMCIKYVRLNVGDPDDWDVGDAE